MTLTTEILLFEASDAYQDNPGLFFSAGDIVLKAQGSHPPLYHGKQIERSSAISVFLNWDSYDAHAAVINSPSYQAIVETVAACASNMDTVQMYHVQFSVPTIPLQQPVTEVLILTLKAPKNRAAAVKILSKISEGSGGKLIFGETREDKDKYFVLAGWQTVEEHLEAIAKPEAAAALDELYALANKDHLFHVSLSQYRLPVTPGKEDVLP